MNNELKQIKKIYGEDTMHLCRNLFPSILEHEGLLLSILKEHFAPTKFLAQEIISQHQEENFKNFIFGFIDVENDIITTNKTPYELMKLAGYTLYECHTEEEIQSFKKYYASDEALCIFKGNRLDTCIVFFAVKDNVDEIKRENFTKPRREDEYGTSVISIQFSRDSVNTLSIKNRYNHRVNNPDNTFYNNLDNIIPGLTHSFNQYYGLDINSNISSKLKLENFVLGSDKKYHHYNIENQNIYFCENNCLIVNGKIDDTYAKEPERYIFLDTYVLDLKDKKLINLLPRFANEFDHILNDLKSIDVFKIKDKKRKITIDYNDDTSLELVVDALGNVISYSDKYSTYIGNNFMRTNYGLRTIDIPNVRSIGDNFLILNSKLQSINFQEVEVIGNSFCANAKEISSVNAPKLVRVGNNFLNASENLLTLELPSLESVGNSFMSGSDNLVTLIVPKLREVEEFFLMNNTTLQNASFPNLILNDGGNSMKYYGFLRDNRVLKSFYVPKCSEEELKKFFLRNPWLTKVYLKTVRETINNAKNSTDEINNTTNHIR